MKSTLSVVILTRQANSALGRHLNILGLADEVVIISDQKPKPSSLPKKVKIYHHPLGKNFASQRNFALKLVSSNWVLFLDDDEKLSPELLREIPKALNESISGFRVRRLDVFFNQTLRHGETGSTKLVRLAQKNAGTWRRPVHEYWKVNGKINDLTSPLFHFHSNLT